MLLDAFSEIFVWVGARADPNAATHTLETAARYRACMHDGRPDHAPIACVRSGHEPEIFKRHFGAWDRASESDQLALYHAKAACAEPTVSPAPTSQAAAGGTTQPPVPPAASPPDLPAVSAGRGGSDGVAVGRASSPERPASGAKPQFERTPTKQGGGGETNEALLRMNSLRKTGRPLADNAPSDDAATKPAAAAAASPAVTWKAVPSAAAASQTQGTDRCPPSPGAAFEMPKLKRTESKAKDEPPAADEADSDKHKLPFEVRLRCARRSRRRSRTTMAAAARTVAAAVTAGITARSVCVRNALSVPARWAGRTRACAQLAHWAERRPSFRARAGREPFRVYVWCAGKRRWRTAWRKTGRR